MTTIKTNAQTIAKLEAAGFKRWTKNGMDRLYIDADRLGLEVTRYANGNAKEGTWQGSEMCKQELQEIDASKVYVDLADGTLHVQTEFVPAYRCDPSVEAVAEAYVASVIGDEEEATEADEATENAEATEADAPLFQRHELDALLGEHAGDFDVEGIIADATEVDGDGNRRWTAFGDDLCAILEAHDTTLRPKAEFRATRETLGITQQALADDLGVRVLSVKRWESPRYPQQAPDMAWELLDALMAAQDEAVADAVARVRETGDGDRRIRLPYWSSQRDYDGSLREDDGLSWTEANATSRRVASVLRWLGYDVRWADGASVVADIMGNQSS